MSNSRVAAFVATLCATTLAGETTSRRSEGVELLKLPYPHDAAVTVSSDTHDCPVETFEAVHKLINTTARITRGSDDWRRIFGENRLDSRSEWRDGINGFDLPIADTMWLYNSSIAVFAGFDENTGQPITHSDKGRDFRDIVDTWLQRGWVDTLHTPGPEDIPRRASEAGLKWMAERPIRRLIVWSDHSSSNTPTCIEPDQRALRPVLVNIVKAGTGLLSWIGLEPLLGRVGLARYPHRFPYGYVGRFWILSVLLVVSALWLIVCLIVKRLRRRVPLTIGGGVLVVVVVVLWAIRIPYCQGDNPGSRYYVADLVRDFGIRFYWMIDRQPGYPTHIMGRLALPERECGGRPSCLRIVTLDDGSRCMVFSRCLKPSPNGYASLELFSEDALNDLCARHGTSIMYIHWTVEPPRVFTTKGLEGLETLKRFRDAGRVWVAPTSEILRFTFVRAYLEYTSRREGDRRVIAIDRVNDPLGKPFVPTLEDLGGISFACAGEGAIEVRLAGKVVTPEKLRIIRQADRTIVMFPLGGRGGATTSSAPTGR